MKRRKLLIKFYKNKNTAWCVDFRFANQAGIIRRWLKLQKKQLYLKTITYFGKNFEEYPIECSTII